MRLIEIGMKFIPEDCRTAKALQDLLLWYKEGKSWTESTHAYFGASWQR